MSDKELKIIEIAKQVAKTFNKPVVSAVLHFVCGDIVDDTIDVCDEIYNKINHDDLKCPTLSIKLIDFKLDKTEGEEQKE